jgi:hypothetical protein
MSTLEDAVKSAIEQAAPGATVTVDAVTPVPAPALPPRVAAPVPAPALPSRVAANLCKLMERVQVTGPEAIAWVEAVQILQQIAGPLLNAAPQGVPFESGAKPA